MFWVIDGLYAAQWVDGVVLIVPHKHKRGKLNMELEFRCQKIILRACMVIPIWFILALFEYWFLGGIVSDLVYILISIGLMVLLAPIFLKMIYRFFHVFFLCNGKAYFTDDTIEFVINKRKKNILKRTITDISYEYISLYGIKIDKITIEYDIGTKGKLFSLYSPDVVGDERNKEFREIYQRLILMRRK